MKRSIGRLKRVKGRTFDDMWIEYRKKQAFKDFRNVI